MVFYCTDEIIRKLNIIIEFIIIITNKIRYATFYEKRLNVSRETRFLNHQKHSGQRASKKRAPKIKNPKSSIESAILGFKI